MKRQRVLVTGASGSMGYETFRHLWKMRDRFDIALLVRPSKKNKRMFRKYEKAAGIRSFRGPGLAEGHFVLNEPSGKGVRGGQHGLLRIVWGDVLNREDVDEACKDIDWCLHLLGVISPEADRHPDRAHMVNYLGTKSVVEAIEAQDPERIRMVYVGSVAQYGERLPPLHMVRVGDPLLPSQFDRYGITKINGELAVMESRIRHRVSLRQTFIMIPDLFSLMDPIMFHQPLHSMMETISLRDAGRMMVRCLEVPGDSEFWGSFYNVSGGPSCRISFLGFLDRLYRMLGMRTRKIMERNWFALQNFHMPFFEDADRLNAVLNHWEGGQDLDAYLETVWRKLPWYIRLAGRASSSLPPFRWLMEKITYGQIRRLAEMERGTLNWIRHGDSEKITAYFGSLENWKAIGGWDDPMPDLDPDQEYRRLEHGYEETKDALTLEDLQQAAGFRGGILHAASWDGDLDRKLEWSCCCGHPFAMSPRSVLRGGHWCTSCIGPPWDYEAVAARNPFVGQVLDLENQES